MLNDTKFTDTIIYNTVIILTYVEINIIHVCLLTWGIGHDVTRVYQYLPR